MKKRRQSVSSGLSLGGDSLPPSPSKPLKTKFSHSLVADPKIHGKAEAEQEEESFENVMEALFGLSRGIIPSILAQEKAPMLVRG